MIFNTHYPYIGGGGGGGVPQYEYTGQSTFIDEGSGNWRLKFLTSGTFALKNKITVDVFLVGGGGAGGGGDYGAGGAGGYTNTVKAQTIKPGTYSIVVGDGGASASSSGNASTAFGFSANVRMLL